MSSHYRKPQLIYIKSLASRFEHNLLLGVIPNFTIQQRRKNYGNFLTVSFIEYYNLKMKVTVKERYLLWLEAAGHAVLVHTAAAVLLAAVAHVVLSGGSVRVTAPTDHHVLPRTQVT